MALDRRKTILEAAARLFAEHGYHTTTVADIAREARVAQGTVYLYFESKKAIFAALVDETLALFKEVLSQGTRIRSRLGAAELQEYLPRVYRHVLELFARNRTLVRLMLTEVRGADPEVQEKLHSFYTEVAEETSRHLRLGAERGVFRPDIDPWLVSQCLIAIMERFAALLLAEPEADIGRMADAVARFELTGILRHG